MFARTSALELLLILCAGLVLSDCSDKEPGLLSFTVETCIGDKRGPTELVHLGVVPVDESDSMFGLSCVVLDGDSDNNVVVPGT